MSVDKILPEHISLSTYGEKGVQVLYVEGIRKIRRTPAFRKAVEYHGGKIMENADASHDVSIYPPIPEENKKAFLGDVALLMNVVNGQESLKRIKRPQQVTTTEDQTIPIHNVIPLRPQHGIK